MPSADSIYKVSDSDWKYQFIFVVLTGGSICNTATQRANLLLMNFKVFIFVLEKIGVNNIWASY